MAKAVLNGVLSPLQGLCTVLALPLSLASATGLSVPAEPSGEAAPITFATYRPDAAREYLESLAEALQSQVGEGADGTFILARIRGQLGETEEAMRLGLQAAEQDPARGDIQSFLAGLMIHEDRMEEAALHLAEAVRLRPGNAEDHRQLGMALDRLGDRTGARSALKRAVELDPDSPVAHMVLGRLLLDLGETEPATEHLQRALALDPSQAGAFYALSEAQRQLGQIEAAEQSLKQFRALKRRERESYDEKNRAYDDEAFMRHLVTGFHVEAAGQCVRQGKRELAENHLRQATRIAPTETRAFELLATLLLGAGQLQDARQVYAELVRLDPERVAYRVNLGTLLLQLKEYAPAIEQLKRVLELDPGRPEALNNLARYYLEARRELPQALSYAQRLAEKAPTAASYDLLGWAYYANGYTNEARTAAAQAVEQDPDNPVYRERLQRLGEAP